AVSAVGVTEAFVLPADVIIVPVAELSEELRGTLDAPDGEFLVSRPGARTGSRIVDEQSADLLERFRSPARIVDAVIAFSRPHVGRLAAREAAILARLDGDSAPRLLASGEQDGRPYLILEWIRGVPARVAADELRRSDPQLSRPRLAALCRAVADAYARLHAR